MGKFLKKGKVVIMLHGRYAGAKAVIVKASEGSTKATGGKTFSRALVVGIAKEPQSVTKTMSKKKIARRSRIKPFIKTVNLNHVLPTRYNFDTDLSTIVASETKDPVAKAKLRKQVRNVFQSRYNSGQQRWFFSKLRF